MRKSLFVLAIIIGWACTGLAQRGFGPPEQETVRRTLEFARSSGRTLEVDNIDGSIRVTGYDGPTVEVTITRSVRAQSPDQMEAAKREVRLEITDHSDVVRFYVDHPGRCKSNDGGNCFNSRNETYRVAFDFDIRVPRDAAIKLRTINGGEINVQKVTGDFDVENVNGGVELTDVAGSGRAYALNGRMKVKFAANPSRASYFGSLNGAVEVAFQPNLSADVRYKTFNGSVFSDFPVEGLPSLVAPTQNRNGQLVSRKDQFQTARIGRGGPELTFDGFNGSIRITEAR